MSWVTIPTLGGSVHGFRLTEGRFTSIDFPGAILTSARAINDAGEIAGAFTTIDDPNGGHGYILREGKFIVMDFPGSSHTGILGINEHGDIAGSYDLGDINTGIGFFTQRGRFISFEVPGSAPMTTGPHGINDDMQVIGFYSDGFDPNRSHGFLLQGGRFRTIDLPDSTLMGLFGINEHGEIVGGCNCIDGTAHAFLLANGGFILISYPVPNSRTRARGINDRTQIVGFYQSGATGPIHGFIAKPKHD